MPYLTLVPAHKIVPRQHLQTRGGYSKLNDPITRHRAVMGLFGELGDQPRSEEHILFRLEVLPGKVPSFLVQSDIPPLPENLPTGSEVKEFSFPELSPGQPVSFRLAVNGIVRVSGGKIRPVPMDLEVDGEDDLAEEACTRQAGMTEWLSAKLADVFSELEIISHQREVLGADRRGTRDDRVVQIDTIDGVATVSDPEKLIEALHTGVGRAKSYGCGLLSVKPLQ